MPFLNLKLAENFVKQLKNTINKILFKNQILLILNMLIFKMKKKSLYIKVIYKI